MGVNRTEKKKELQVERCGVRIKCGEQRLNCGKSIGRRQGLDLLGWLCPDK